MLLILEFSCQAGNQHFSFGADRKGGSISTMSRASNSNPSPKPLVFFSKSMLDDSNSYKNVELSIDVSFQFSFFFF